MAKVRVGLVGTGGICNGTHIPGYLECPDCEITALCDIDPEHLKKTADRVGLSEDRCFSDYRDLIGSGLVDAVDVTTSNDFHVEIACAALDAGFPVSVEKPIGVNFDQSLKLLNKSRAAGLPVFVCFSWRYRPFSRYMKVLLEQGVIGDPYHFYFQNIKDSGLWKGRRLEWRFQKDKAGSGVLCDLGSHLFDALRFYGQEVEGVYCVNGIFIKERQKIGSDEWAPVTTDDWDNVVLTLKSGASGEVNLSRTAITQKDTLVLDAMGSKGGVRFESHAGKYTLTKCTGDDIVTNSYRPIEIPQSFVCPSQSASFVHLVQGHLDPYSATIEDGIKSQAIVDAALRSVEEKRMVRIDEMFAQA